MLEPERINWKGILLILMIIIIAIFVQKAGPGIADFVDGVFDTFYIASPLPNDHRGFAAFIRLILYAIFIGIAIRLFRR